MRIFSNSLQSLLQIILEYYTKICIYHTKICIYYTKIEYLCTMNTLYRIFVYREMGKRFITDQSHYIFLPQYLSLNQLNNYSSLLIFRQVVARTILETLRVVTDDPDDVNSVLNVMTKLADDIEPSVRAELMEQVPHIAMYGQEYKAKLAHVVPQHLLPMVVKFLTDTNNQVRKTSQAALLVLLEQGLVERSDVQEQVCPVIIRLTEADSLDDYRTEAVAVSSYINIL